MKRASFTSDYSSSTRLNLIQTDDGDICIDICGDGECRIATNGGQIHGARLAMIANNFSEIIDLLNTDEDSPDCKRDDNGFSDYWEEN